jgi:hypothetical protein
VGEKNTIFALFRTGKSISLPVEQSDSIERIKLLTKDREGIISSYILQYQIMVGL